MSRQLLSRRCSFCRSQGHYSTTCPLRPKDNRCMLFGVNLLKRKQGKPWTREEHRAFLRGLEVYGPSRWKQISEDFVKTRTPNQIASHAQKYNLWLKAAANDPDKRSRCSIFQVPAATDSPPITHVSSSAGRVGASETTSRAHHFANITASNPLFATTAVANLFFANATAAANPLFANATAPANPLFATTTAAANPLFANATAANPLSYLCKLPTGHSYPYPHYKVAAPINLQQNPPQTYSRMPMPNLPFVRRMYDARRFQPPVCLAPHVHF